MNNACISLFTKSYTLLCDGFCCSGEEGIIATEEVLCTISHTELADCPGPKFWTSLLSLSSFEFIDSDFGDLRHDGIEGGAFKELSV